MRRAADDPRLISPAGVAQSPSLGSGLQSIGRLATRTIIVLTAALVATVGVILLLSGHRPADQYRAAALQPAVVSPPTLAIAAGAAGLSGAALSPTITVASAGLSEERGRRPSCPVRRRRKMRLSLRPRPLSSRPRRALLPRRWRLYYSAGTRCSRRAMLLPHGSFTRGRPWSETLWPRSDWVRPTIRYFSRGLV